MSKKEKEFIIFVIDIYNNYAEELNLNSVEQHEIIIKELNKIKENLEK